MSAYGYFRQSRRADLDVDLSPEQQRRDIEALAARDGATIAAIFEDLGKSGGRGKEQRRHGYQELLGAITVARTDLDALAGWWTRAKRPGRHRGGQPGPRQTLDAGS
jgi:DNA invertase Pin-like site-specific DNA recombinase